MANGWIALWFELSLTFCFAFSIWLSSVWLESVGSLVLSRNDSLPYCFWNMLLNAFLKPKGCATTYRLSQWHAYSSITTLVWLAGSAFFLAAGSVHCLKKIKRGDTAPYQFCTELLIWCSNCWEADPIHGAQRYTGHFSSPKGLAIENCAIFLDMSLSTISSGCPLSSKIFLIKSISCLSLFFVLIIRGVASLARSGGEG